MSGEKENESQRERKRVGESKRDKDTDTHTHWPPRCIVLIMKLKMTSFLRDELGKY